jgi:IS30 family transposase
VVFTGKIEEYVNALLAEKYSPEQIVGVPRRDGKICVSHERIYQQAWANKKQVGPLLSERPPL